MDHLHTSIGILKQTFNEGLATNSRDSRPSAVGVAGVQLQTKMKISYDIQIFRPLLGLGLDVPMPSSRTLPRSYVLCGLLSVGLFPVPNSPLPNHDPNHDQKSTEVTEREKYTVPSGRWPRRVRARVSARALRIGMVFVFWELAKAALR